MVGGRAAQRDCLLGQAQLGRVVPPMGGQGRRRFDAEVAVRRAFIRAGQHLPDDGVSVLADIAVHRLGRHQRGHQRQLTLVAVCDQPQGHPDSAAFLAHPA